MIKSLASIITSCIALLLAACSFPDKLIFSNELIKTETTELSGTVEIEGGTEPLAVDVASHIAHTTTDENGRFTIHSELKDNGEFLLRFQRKGCFTAYKYMETGNTLITLYPKKESYNVKEYCFEASEGHVCPVDEHLNITIESDAIADETQINYQGKVYCHILNLPEDANYFNNFKPGHEMGRSKHHIGTFCIELSDPKGNPLQLKKGKKALVSLVDNILPQADLSAGLCHFDFDKGMWILHWRLTRSSNTGKIDKMGWWNYSYFPYKIKRIDFQAVDANSRPLPYATLRTGFDDPKIFTGADGKGSLMIDGEYHNGLPIFSLESYTRKQEGHKFPYETEPISAYYPKWIVGKETNTDSGIKIVFDVNSIEPEADEPPAFAEYTNINNIDSDKLININGEQYGIFYPKSLDFNILANNRVVYINEALSSIAYTDSNTCILKSYEIPHLEIELFNGQDRTRRILLDTTSHEKGKIKAVRKVYCPLGDKGAVVGINWLNWLNQGQTIYRTINPNRPIKCYFSINGGKGTLKAYELPNQKIDLTYPIWVKCDGVGGENCKIESITDAYGRNAQVAGTNAVLANALTSGKLHFVCTSDNGQNTFEFSQEIPHLSPDNFTGRKKEAIREDGISWKTIIVFALYGLFFIGILTVSSKDQKERVRMAQAIAKVIAKVLNLNPSLTANKKELIKDYDSSPNDKQQSIYFNTLKFLAQNDFSITEEDFKIINQKLEAARRRELVRLLFKLAAEDDGIKNDEWNTINSLMVSLKINKKNIDYMRQQYSPLRTERDDYSRYYSRSQSTYTSASVAYASDYAVLGLTTSATKDEVQDRYHKLAMEFHPDLPKNANRQDFCIAQMSKINKAYTNIIKRLG